MLQPQGSAQGAGVTRRGEEPDLSLAAAGRRQGRLTLAGARPLPTFSARTAGQGPGSGAGQEFKPVK